MISLAVSLCVIIAGYFVWGKLTEKVFSPDNRQTPAYIMNDGVDCMPLKTWRAFLIQLLNIAGTGPIFGALMGAVFGPVVFLWIVFGSILGGAVHDYMTGMISCRNKGKSIAELSGLYLAKYARWIMRFFTIILLLLCGTVFITGPAELLAYLTPTNLSKNFWLAVIIVYYILATILPIDKVIAKIYPVFGFVLIAMAISILGGLIAFGYTIPEISLTNMHPAGLSSWPFMFITVACGAISGFHATQSPMISKCIKTEKVGRKVFYSAMLCEAVIALIWAAAGVAFYGATDILKNALDELGQSGVVYQISTGVLGNIGGILAVIGVIICPITSGDTAFRAVRLILAETTKLNQKKILNRLVLSIPIFVIAAVLTQIDYNMIWRYFSWSNQTLAMISLWVSTAYLLKNCKYKYGSLLTALPATFMSAVTLTYILMAQEGFKLPSYFAYPAGIVFAVLLFAIYVYQFYHLIILPKTSLKQT